MDKLCECGCGQPTRLAPQSNTKTGWVKGRPIRFIVGHNHAHQQRTGHYSARSFGGKILLEHRVRAMLALGKPLPAAAIVHHVDGIPHADSPLVICQDQAYHLGLHRRLRILRAGGNAWRDKVCCQCKAVKPRDEFSYNRGVHSNGSSDDRYGACRVCQRVSMNRRFHAKQAARDQRFVGHWTNRRTLTGERISLASIAKYLAISQDSLRWHLIVKPATVTGTVP
jgi:hypothetical protein